MTGNRYASGTQVSPDRSRAEIERTLMRYGATGFVYGWDGNIAMIGFRYGQWHVRFRLPLPISEDVERTPKGRKRRGSALPAVLEQEKRRRWRSLSLAVKAKLDTVATGITTFETEFLPYIVLPNGESVGEWLTPQLDDIYKSRKMPPLLPG